MRLLTILISASALGLTLMAGIAPASAIDITITSLSNGTGADTWLDGTAINQTRNGGTASLSNEQSLDGDGSLRLYSPDASGKATALYAGAAPLGALRNLSGAGYQYYRDSSSTNPLAQAPSLRLYVSNGEGRNGVLIYEPVYNGVPVTPEDSWQTVFADAGNWWLFENGDAFENYALDLEDWVTGNTFTDSDGQTTTGFGVNALVLGIDVGIGSGWDGTSLAYVDNIEISFTVDDKAQIVIWNFQAQQTEVPEPTTLMLMGTGLAGLYLARRRRRTS